MNAMQAEEIRKLVDSQGWDAVRSHPVLGSLWAAEVKRSQQYVDAISREF